MANQHGIAQVELSLGYENHFKLGTWTPARVTISAGETEFNGKIRVTVPDNDAVPTTITWPATGNVQVKAGETETFVIPVKIGKAEAPITLGLESQDQGNLVLSQWTTSTTQSTVILASQKFFLQIGEDTSIDQVIQSFDAQKDEEYILVRLSDTADLPDRWYLLEGVDQVLITTADVGPVQQLASTQLEALHKWVQMGGRLLLSVGINGDQLLGENQPLARFSPGKFQEVIKQRDTVELEVYAGDGKRVDAGDPTPLEISLLESPQGTILVTEDTVRNARPLIVRSPMGFGLVDFIAFDLDRAPISNWDGRHALLSKLLKSDAQKSAETAISQQQVGKSAAHLGYQDISGQLRMALDQFSGVQLISFLLIGTIIVVYILMIGPGDYFLLKKCFPRMEWTWFTFPVMVIGTCVLIWQVAVWAKGTELKVNQIDLVDIDIESGLIRTTTWAHLYSPQTQHYDINLEGNLPAPTKSWNHLMSWHGLPGTSLGGMNNKQSLSMLQEPYQVVLTENNSNTAGESIQLKHTPIQTWSSSSFLDQGWTTLDEGETEAVEPLVQISSNVITGAIRNPTHLTFTDCYLFSGSRVRYVDSLPPGGTFYFNETYPTQTIHRVLRKTRLSEASERSQHWDRQDVGIDRIMEVMTLYDAAGGRGYVNLMNRYQQHVDLSSHIANGRAVLICRAEQPATKLSITGSQQNLEAKTTNWTYYRLVFPVTLEP
ncbi:MAG: hypothetical protein ACKVH8_15785 [Pirellulales bacterium]